jgi:hypothetical protein
MHVYFQGNAPPVSGVAAERHTARALRRALVASRADARERNSKCRPTAWNCGNGGTAGSLHFILVPHRFGDINDDGYDDFAMASKTDNHLHFIGGNPLTITCVHRAQAAAGFVAADFNRDGRMDIATANQNFVHPLASTPRDAWAHSCVPAAGWTGTLGLQEDMLIEGQPATSIAKNSATTHVVR